MQKVVVAAEEHYEIEDFVAIQSSEVGLDQLVLVVLVETLPLHEPVVGHGTQPLEAVPCETVDVLE